MAIWFFPWAGGRRQVTALCDQILNARIIRRHRSKYRHKVGDIVINWGSSICPPCLERVKVLNPFGCVGAGKREQYGLFASVNIPSVEYTHSREKAFEWQKEGYKILGRDVDHGMGGKGIQAYRTDEEIGYHLFYTKYVNKKREFRFHVMNGQVIFVQEKMKNRDEEQDPLVRSHSRGWHFAFNRLENKPPPDGLELLAIQAVKTLGLDFGAVDMGWHPETGPCIYEVNTAPGIENTTLKVYALCFSTLKD